MNPITEQVQEVGVTNIVESYKRDMDILCALGIEDVSELEGQNIEEMCKGKSREFVKKLCDTVCHFNISYKVTNLFDFSKLPFTEEFMTKHQDKLVWDCISINKSNMSIEFIYKHWGKLNWYILFKRKKFSEEELIKIMSLLKNDEYWVDISETQDLSEEFMINNANNLNMEIISETQKLSEQFIMNNLDMGFYWPSIVSCQRHLSRDFLFQFYESARFEFAERFNCSPYL